MIPQADISEVHAALVTLGPEAVAQQLGLQVRRDRRGVVGPCPLHGGDNARSWALHERDGRLVYHCLTRGCDGDAIRLIGELSGAAGFGEQLRAAAEIAGVALDVTDPAERAERERRRATRAAELAARKAQRARERAAAYDARARLYGELWALLELQGPAVPYLRERGMVHPSELYAPASAAGVVWCEPEHAAAALDELRPRWGADAFERFGLVWPARDGMPAAWRFKRHQLLFPLHDSAGRLLWFQGRDIRDDVPHDERWQSPLSTPLASGGKAGQGPALYGAGALQRHDPAHTMALLTEGATDWLSARVWCAELARVLDVGELVPIGKAGTGALLPEAAAQLRGWRVVIAYDSDDAGRKGSGRAGDTLRAAGAVSARRLSGLPSGYDLAKYIRQRFGASAQPQQRSAAPDRSETRSDAA